MRTRSGCEQSPNKARRQGEQCSSNFWAKVLAAVMVFYISSESLGGEEIKIMKSTLVRDSILNIPPLYFIPTMLSQFNSFASLV